MAVTVRAPASSANLGPGFDACALALALYDEVTAEPGADATTVVVRGEGEGELPTGEEHLVVRSLHAAFRELGIDPPPVTLSCWNQIPQARGLGSSSAAIVAGVLLGRALVARVSPARAEALDRPALLRLAARLEGHPDNVAACLLGGLAVAWEEPGGARAAQLQPAADLQPVLFVPQQRGLTVQARAALPAEVPHADAAHAAGRAALLVHALTGDPRLLFAATEDRLHQPYRVATAPASGALLVRLRTGGVPAVLSGAGPSVLAFGPVSPDLMPDQGWIHHVLEVDRYGATVQVGTMPPYTG